MNSVYLKTKNILQLKQSKSLKSLLSQIDEEAETSANKFIKWSHTSSYLTDVNSQQYLIFKQSDNLSFNSSHLSQIRDMTSDLRWRKSSEEPHKKELFNTTLTQIQIMMMNMIWNMLTQQDLSEVSDSLSEQSLSKFISSNNSESQMMS